MLTKRSMRSSENRRWASARGSVTAFAAAMILATSAVSCAALPAGAAVRWSVVPSVSPAGPPEGDLAAVSCSNASDCFAVGDGLFEHWNGASWSIVAAPPGNGLADNVLDAVSCTSPSSCFAVGGSYLETEVSFTAKPLTERWNGTSWSIVASPSPANQPSSSLADVSCISATNCWAVGSSTSSSIDSDQLTGSVLVEHWDGSTWSIVTVPSPNGSTEAELLGVSCVSAASCFAVGDFETPSIGGALREHWNGAAWSIAAGPDANAAMRSAHASRVLSPARRRAAVGGLPIGIIGEEQPPGLQGVSCSSDSSCLAVGTSFSGALAERWNGASWSDISTPTPPNSAGADLAAISCASATDCSAVGTEGAVTISGTDEEVDSAPLQEHWNGTAWSVVAGPPGAQVDELSGVSCPTSTSCAAVGDSALVERWDGARWTIAPFGAKTSQSQLQQLACASASNCFSVGTYATATSEGRALIEHWNGKAWSMVATPTPSASSDAQLTGISCANATNCMAVGSSEGPDTGTTLVEHWNGARWSVLASPNAKGADESQLSSVSCPAVNRCTAVGFTFSETGGKILVEQWNGKAWSITPVAAPSGAQVAELIGVTCTTATNCTAVGTSASLQGTRTPGARALVEHYDGTAWTSVPTASPAGAAFVFLVGVSCTSASSCLAVGFDTKSVVSSEHAMSERWNGKAWTVVSTPVPRGSVSTELSGVACHSASSCDAVGAASASAIGNTLIEHWNGSAWVIVPSPSSGAGGALNGVACPSAASCLAVGLHIGQDSMFTLAEQGP
jgi:hypothetical protein